MNCSEKKILSLMEAFQKIVQQKLLPLTKLLISMILYGPDVKREISESQACNTISQLLLHNAKKQKVFQKVVAGITIKENLLFPSI